MIVDRFRRKICRIYEEQKWLQIREKTEVDSRSYFFESYSASNFQGNVFYIYRKMFLNEQFSNAVFYIASKDKTATERWLMAKGLYDGRTVIVTYLSREYITALYSSRYIFNNVSFPMNFVKKDEQMYINTWHGTPLKHIGKRAGNDPLTVQNMQRDFLSCDYLLSPNHSTTEIYEDDFNVKGLTVNEILEIGYPRNEIFYDDSYRHRERVRLGVDDKVVIFYMPTWRSNKASNYHFVERMEELAQRLGEKYNIFIKLHPLDQSGNHLCKNVKYMPEEYEVYEFLQCCDVLITDYSSVLFDFSNTGRKVVLYQFDRSEYYDERGIYQNIAEKIPFPIAKTLDEVEARIKETPIAYQDFVDLFCREDKEGVTNKILDLLNSQNVGTVKECGLKIVVDSNEITTCEEDLKNRLLYLLPQKKNGFFAGCLKLEDAFFAVGSNHGHYAFKETISILLSKLVRVPCLVDYVESVYARERKRMLGQLKIKSISSDSSIPDYLHSFKRR